MSDAQDSQGQSTPSVPHPVQSPQSPSPSEHLSPDASLPASSSSSSSSPAIGQEDVDLHISAAAAAPPLPESPQTPRAHTSASTAPPPPPMAFLSPVRPPFVPPPAVPTLSVKNGNLTSALHSSLESNRWLLAILDFNSTLPYRLLTGSEDLSDAVNAWRPRKGSSFAESYTSFFPASADLHIALLDPRSGERLHVWGEPTGEDEDDAEDVDWDDVINYLKTFISQHSLDGHDLGPLHHRDKPWAVRTKRDTPALTPLPPTSVMDDEEEAIAAAIAASLNESKNIQSSEDEYEFDDDDEDMEDEEDEDESVQLEEDEEGQQVDDDQEQVDDQVMEDEDMKTGETSVDTLMAQDSRQTGESSATDSEGSASDRAEVVPMERQTRTMPSAMPIPGTTSWVDVASAGTPVSFPGPVSDQRADGDTRASRMLDRTREATTTSSSFIPISRRTSMPMPTMPARSPALSRSLGVPSSVESVASSLMERANSRFKSANDPTLLDWRREREAQDAELAASLEADRLKERARLDLERAQKAESDARKAAIDSLPSEPENGNNNCLTVALRLPGGERISRRFPKSARLADVAKLCFGASGNRIDSHLPHQVLWNRSGVLDKNAGWDDQLEHAISEKHRVMFIVHQ